MILKNKDKPIKLSENVKLTKKEKKRLSDAFKKAKLTGKFPKSAQQTLPYQTMYKDGICHIEGDYYTKTIQFFDISYGLASERQKENIFNRYCDFLNYFDNSITFELSFINQKLDMEEYKKGIDIPLKRDKFNDVRKEFKDMLIAQLSRGNNGLEKLKYVTFGIRGNSLKEVKPRLLRIEADILANFKKMTVRAFPLDGYERLKLMHKMLHPENERKFRFGWDAIYETGLTTKDFIAPNSFSFKGGKTFKLGDNFGAVSFLEVNASKLDDKVLKNILDMDSNLSVTFHIKTIDQVTAIKSLKRKLSDIDAMKIQEQKKAVKGGYDMDIMPTDLITYREETQGFLEDLESKDERMFLVTIIVVNTAKTMQKLKNDLMSLSGIVQQSSLELRRLEYNQEQGFVSSLPLGVNKVEIQRGLPTYALAIFIPFTTSELFQKGDALYYGVNALSNNLIMADRKLLRTPNGLILGTPGSGKSFSAKKEISNSFFVTDDDIAVLDPEGEYSPVVQTLGGQVIKISPISTQYINPMDINLNYSEDDDPLILKSDFILSLFELIMGTVQADERSIIDQCLRKVYRKFFVNPKEEEMPILQDLYNELVNYGNEKATHIAECMAIYVTGSLSVFNHRTNVNVDNRIVCYDIKELGNALKKIGMLIVQDQVWGRVTKNRELHKSTRYYIDEMHLLLKEKQTASYTVEIWKRFRKWGGIPTGLTQNVKDFLDSREVENILENSDFIYLLNQAPNDGRILADSLGISPEQLAYVTNSGAGEGLIIYGSVILPFVDHFPKNTKLYKIMTTRPQDLVENKNE